MVPYLPKFETQKLQRYNAKSSPNQHLYHFRSLIDNVMADDALMFGLFLELSWLLPSTSSRNYQFVLSNHELVMKLGSSLDLQRQDRGDSTHILLNNEKKGEPISNFIEKFKNLAFRYPEGMLVSIMIQTYQYDLLIELESRMGVIKGHSRKDLI